MWKDVEAKPKKRFYEERAHKHSKHVKVLRELPTVADERIKNIARRNELLRANHLYNARLERQRALSAFSTTTNMRQRDVIRQYMGQLQTNITTLAQRGMLPMDLAPS